MIEKFNFYDVYGYLIPGLVILGLLWVPIGIFRGRWPSAALGSTILILIFSYLLGHLLQITVRAIVPPKPTDRYGKARFPSDVLLDREGPFSQGLKRKIAKLCWDRFGIDVCLGQDPGNTDEQAMGEISKARNEAFLRARRVLQRDDKQGYAEQFEGLYAMMSGLVIALAGGAFYFVGWSAVLCGCNPEHPVIWGTVLLIAAPFCAMLSRLTEQDKDRANSKERKRLERVERQWEWALAIALAGVSVWGGILVAETPLPSPNRSLSPLHTAWMMFVLALACSFAAIRLYGSYKYFAIEFARTVWRDFGDSGTVSSDPADGL